MAEQVRELPEWHQRLIKERQELAERIDKLAMYRATSAFDALHVIDRMLLIDQLRHMQSYHNVLWDRLTRADAAARGLAGEH